MTIHVLAPSIDKFDTLDEQVNNSTTGLWLRVDSLENTDPIYTLIKAYDITKSYPIGYPILKDGGIRIANTAVSVGAYNDSNWTNPGTRPQSEPVVTTTADGAYTMTFTATTGGGTIEISDGTTTKTMSFNSDRGRLNFANACDLADANANDNALVKDIIKLDGDLGGTLASPKVAKIQNIEIDTTAPEANQALVYDAGGAKYVPTNVTLADENGNAYINGGLNETRSIFFQEVGVPRFSIESDGSGASPDNLLKIKASPASAGTLSNTAIEINQDGKVNLGNALEVADDIKATSLDLYSDDGTTLSVGGATAKKNSILFKDNEKAMYSIHYDGSGVSPNNTLSLLASEGTTGTLEVPVLIIDQDGKVKLYKSLEVTEGLVSPDGTKSIVVADSGITATGDSTVDGDLEVAGNITSTRAYGQASFSGTCVDNTNMPMSAEKCSDGTYVTFDLDASSFTLKAGKTYKVDVVVGGLTYAAITDNVAFRIAKVGWITMLGISGRIYPQGSEELRNLQPTATAIITPSVDTSYRIYCSTVEGTVTVSSYYSGVTITEV